MTKSIISMGGSILADAYDSNCLGIIAGKLARSEKLMACIASGKGVIHASYVEDSAKAGHFLPVSLVSSCQTINDKRTDHFCTLINLN